jgi:hypothetical protein
MTVPLLRREDADPAVAATDADCAARYPTRLGRECQILSAFLPGGIGSDYRGGVQRVAHLFVAPKDRAIMPQPRQGENER